MAGSCTITDSGPNRSCNKVMFEWTSAGGSADATTTQLYTGKLIGLTTIPGAVNIPADDYDVTLLDADGHDVLNGAGVDRDLTDTEHVAGASLGAVSMSALTLAVRNTGGNDDGTVIVWIR